MILPPTNKKKIGESSIWDGMRDPCFLFIEFESATTLLPSLRATSFKGEQQDGIRKKLESLTTFLTHPLNKIVQNQRPSKLRVVIIKGWEIYLSQGRDSVSVFASYIKERTISERLASNPNPTSLQNRRKLIH